jgi:hypothetical protein
MQSVQASRRVPQRHAHFRRMPWVGDMLYVYTKAALKQFEFVTPLNNLGIFFVCRVYYRDKNFTQLRNGCDSFRFHSFITPNRVIVSFHSSKSVPEWN